MKPNRIITVALGVLLTAFGIFGLVQRNVYEFIPLIIGVSLIYLGWRGGRAPLIVFGHACIVVGFMLVTLGIYIAPHAQPTLVHVFFRPLFWGLFSVGGGVCALFHAFCSCMRRQPQAKI